MTAGAAFSGHLMTMVSIDSLVVDIVAFQALRVIAPINIEEFMSCFPEMLWFVNENDALKAYSVLYQLCKTD